MPADLRIDHVYLVSCKYLSKILRNSSPAGLFDGCLGERPADTVADWYAGRRARRVRGPLAGRCARTGPTSDLPDVPGSLDRPERKALAYVAAGEAHPQVDKAYRRFAHAVADRSARRWSAALPDVAARERMLWRMLRLTGAPYFVLGSSGAHVAAAAHRHAVGLAPALQAQGLRGVGRAGRPAAGPLAGGVTDRELGTDRSVRGHVEVRWSHGRFRGAPEAKVYLDTPPGDVPGFWPLT